MGDDASSRRRGRNPQPALDAAARRAVRATLSQQERKALRQAALGRDTPDGGWLAALVAEEAIWLRRWLGVMNAIAGVAVVLSLAQWAVSGVLPLQLLILAALLALSVPRRGAAKRTAREMREVGDVAALERRAASA